MAPYPSYLFEKTRKGFIEEITDAAPAEGTGMEVAVGIDIDVTVAGAETAHLPLVVAKEGDDGKMAVRGIGVDADRKIGEQIDLPGIEINPLPGKFA